MLGFGIILQQTIEPKSYLKAALYRRCHLSLLSTKITQEHAFQLIHVEREHVQTMSDSDKHHQDITKRQSSSQKADNVDPTVPVDASKPATPQIEGILQGLGNPSLLAPQSPLLHRSRLDPHRREFCCLNEFYQSLICTSPRADPPPQQSSGRAQNDTSTNQGSSSKHDQDDGHTGDRRGHQSDAPNADAAEDSITRSAQEDREPSWLSTLNDSLHNLQREINSNAQDIRNMQAELNNALANGNACPCLKAFSAAHTQTSSTTGTSHETTVQSTLLERLDEIQGELRVMDLSMSGQLDTVHKEVEENEDRIQKIFVVPGLFGNHT